MSGLLCDYCQLHPAKVCCICVLPLPSYCSDHFPLHKQDECSLGMPHCEVPLEGRAIIDSQAKLVQLRKALLRLGDYQDMVREATQRVASDKEQLFAFFTNFSKKIYEDFDKILHNLDAVNQRANDAIQTADIEIMSNLPAANEALGLLFSQLTDIYALVGNVEKCLETCSPDSAASVLESYLGVSCEEQQRRSTLEVVLRLPSEESLGQFSFSADTQVKSLYEKVEESTKLSRFELFFGSTMLRSDQLLGQYNLPKLAVVTIAPVITVWCSDSSSSHYISDKETVGSLKAMLSKDSSHYVLSKDMLLDDDFVLLNADRDSIFDIIESNSPKEVIFLRAENHQIYELPVIDPDEAFFFVKHRTAEVIRYDENYIRLLFRSHMLSDETALSSMGVQGGSVLDLERWTRIYVQIPAASTTLSLLHLNNEATVLSVKTEIASQLDLPIDYQVLLYRDQEREDNYSLSCDYKSSVNVALHMKHYLLGSYEPTEFVAIEFFGSEERVGELKSRLAEKLNSPADLMILAFRGENVRESASLQDVGIGEDCLVSLRRSLDASGGVYTNSATLQRNLYTISTPDKLAKMVNSFVQLELESTTRVVVRYCGFEDLVLENLGLNTRISSLKESVRVKFLVPVAEQSLYHGLKRAEDVDLLRDFTPRKEDEGRVFDLQVRVVPS